MDEHNERVIQKITSALKETPLEDLPVLAFDKWTAFDNTKFIGIYLYCAQKTYCLGLVNFTGFCGNEQIKELVQDRLGTFGLILDDICVFFTDSGADVKKMVQSIGAFHLLDHAYTPVAVMPQKPMTLNDFLSRKRPAPSLDLSSVLLNLKPTSVDPERFISLGRLSKNHLQGKMSAQHHDRNVFLEKTHISFKQFHVNVYCSSYLCFSCCCILYFLFMSLIR